MEWVSLPFSFGSFCFDKAEGESSSGGGEEAVPSIHGGFELSNLSILISPPFCLRSSADVVGCSCLSRFPICFYSCCGPVVPDLGEFRRRGFVDRLFAVVHGSVVGVAVLF